MERGEFSAISASLLGRLLHQPVGARHHPTTKSESTQSSNEFRYEQLPANRYTHSVCLSTYLLTFMSFFLSFLIVFSLLGIFLNPLRFTCSGMVPFLHDSLQFCLRQTRRRAGCRWSGRRWTRTRCGFVPGLCTFRSPHFPHVGLITHW